MWGFANLGFDPGQQLWDAVAQNSIYTMHDYSPQNIANGAAVLYLCLPEENVKFIMLSVPSQNG